MKSALLWIGVHFGIHTVLVLRCSSWKSQSRSRCAGCCSVCPANTKDLPSTMKASYKGKSMQQRPDKFHGHPWLRSHMLIVHHHFRLSQYSQCLICADAVSIVPISMLLQLVKPWSFKDFIPIICQYFQTSTHQHPVLNDLQDPIANITSKRFHYAVVNQPFVGVIAYLHLVFRIPKSTWLRRPFLQ